MRTSLMTVLAAACILRRVVYIGAYIAGVGTIRSTVWTLAFPVNIPILFAGR